MDLIISMEKEKISEVTNHLENFINNLHKITYLNVSSLNNMIDKLRLLNKDFDNIKHTLNNIIFDLVQHKCIKDSNLELKLKEENELNTMIHNLSPLILAYQMKLLCTKSSLKEAPVDHVYL